MGGRAVQGPARLQEISSAVDDFQTYAISRSEFLQEYKSAVARRLKVFTNRENVALSREALRNVLVDGRLVLRPDAANARFEGTLTLSHEEFLKEKQVDIKMVAGARLRLIARSSFRSRALTAAARLPASRFPTTVVTAIG